MIFIISIKTVHIGQTLHSGHYIAYIFPKADGNTWYKFDDSDVTRCSSFDAIEGNYGDGVSDNSAYMLIYIKRTNIPEFIHREVREDEVKYKTKIRQRISKGNKQSPTKNQQQNFN